jgi:hypothetical protein
MPRAFFLFVTTFVLAHFLLPLSSAEACLNDFEALRQALLSSSEDAETPTSISLCANSTVVVLNKRRRYSDIDITNKAFALSCEEIASCTILAGSSRFYSGTPVSAILDGVVLEGGVNVAGGGGATSLTGGITHFRNCTFRGNQADLSGAIFAQGQDTNVVRDDCLLLETRVNFLGPQHSFKVVLTAL